MNVALRYILDGWRAGQPLTLSDTTGRIRTLLELPGVGGIVCHGLAAAVPTSPPAVEGIFSLRRRSWDASGKPFSEISCRSGYCWWRLDWRVFAGNSPRIPNSLAIPRSDGPRALVSSATSTRARLTNDRLPEDLACRGLRDQDRSMRRSRCTP